jgi:adenosylhomocysteine nucleosidase
MAYIADLSTYNYGPFSNEHPDPKLLAVGWLDRSIPYNEGFVRRDLVRRLLKLAAKPVNLTRGFHICEYCEASWSARDKDRCARGNGEIRVKGINGTVYAAPVLICHYIQAHNYRPPDGFLEAVQNLPQSSAEIAIVAALDREILPLVKNWPSSKLTHAGCEFTIYESDYAVIVCGGIGQESARRAAEAVIRRYSPDLLISAGIAGALVSELHVGDTLFPSVVIDTQDSSRHETAIQKAPIANTTLGRTILATYPEIASVSQKQQLAKSYGAHAVDMEAAAVARAAQKHNLPFFAVKSISDELDFELSAMNRFIRQGQFRTKSFVQYIAPRPWLWLRVIRLARNTQRASENLCAWLRESALTNTIVPGIGARTGEMPVPPQI